MQDKKTIIYFGGFELPDKNAAAQRVVANAKLFKDLGFNVVLVGIDKSNEFRVNVFETKKTLFTFDVFSVSYPNSNFKWLKFIFLFKSFKDLILNYSNVAYIICYNLPSGSLFRLLKYAKRRKIKIISDCTEWYETPKTANFVFRFIKSLDTYLRMEVINPKLDGVISISKFLYDFYTMRGVKTIQVPPLVDIKDLKWSKTSFNEVEYIKFIYVGSPFSKRYPGNAKDRLDLIISALKILKKRGNSFKLDIVGVSFTDFVEFFPNMQIDLMQLDSFVQFFGTVSHEIAINMLKESDFSIFLRSETLITKAGFPTKFVESISLGIPVITNQCSNIKDYLVDGHNGFWIDSSNADSIADGLERIVSLSKSEIEKIKIETVRSNKFDYRNYYDIVSSFWGEECMLQTNIKFEKAPRT